MSMKTEMGYWGAILTWMSFAAVLAATSAIVFSIIWPLLLRNVFGLSFPPRDDLSRAINWSVVGIVVVLYCLFFTRTGIGRKLLQWFLESNRGIFFKK
jgi:hypothetical protein